jgi:hypothetical protein
MIDSCRMSACGRDLSTLGLQLPPGDSGALPAGRGMAPFPTSPLVEWRPRRPGGEIGRRKGLKKLSTPLGNGGREWGQSRWNSLTRRRARAGRCLQYRAKPHVALAFASASCGKCRDLTAPAYLTRALRRAGDRAKVKSRLQMRSTHSAPAAAAKAVASKKIPRGQPRTGSIPVPGIPRLPAGDVSSRVLACVLFRVKRRSKGFRFFCEPEELEAVLDALLSATGTRLCRAVKREGRWFLREVVRLAEVGMLATDSGHDSRVREMRELQERIYGRLRKALRSQLKQGVWGRNSDTGGEHFYKDILISDGAADAARKGLVLRTLLGGGFVTFSLDRVQ